MNDPTMMKRCIWCLKTNEDVTFDKVAHILPQGLGAKEVCEEECDNCNEFFGQREAPRKPSIDIVLKETLILSKYMKLTSILRYQQAVGVRETRKIFGKTITKNNIQQIGKSTELFKIKISEKERSIKPKNAFRHYAHSPRVFTNYLKRGLMKVAFEKAYISDHLHDSFYSEFYDYIRDFVRWNKGNPKIYYLKRKLGAEMTAIDYLINPRVLLHTTKNNYLKFEILNHLFAISLGNLNLTEHAFLNQYRNDKLFTPVEIRSFLDIDIFNTVFHT